MQKSKRFSRILHITLLVAAGLCLGWTDTWDDIKAAAAKVTAISAEFTQEKHMKILVRPLVSKGVFHFQAPRSLRWEYHSPIHSILLTHNSKTRRYIQKDGKFIEDAGARLQSMQVVLQEITRWLNGRFDENPAFSTRLEPGQKIVLRPKDKALERMIQRIEINLADRPGIIKSVIIYEANDSFTKIEFKNVILNPSLQDSLFRKV